MVKSSKGFSLTELLVVIIIVGILLLVGIPAITRTINNSRKDAFVTSAKSYIAGARNGIDSKMFKVAYANQAIYTSFFTDTANSTTQTQAKALYCKTPPAGYFTLVRIEDIENEKNVTTSPWKASWQAGYVAIVNTGTATNDKLGFYIALVDKKKNGIDKFISEDSLSRKDVKYSTANVSGAGTQLGTLVGAYKTLNLNFNDGAVVKITKSTTNRTIGDKSNLKLYMICR